MLRSRNLFWNFKNPRTPDANSIRQRLHLSGPSPVKYRHRFNSRLVLTGLHWVGHSSLMPQLTLLIRVRVYIQIAGGSFYLSVVDNGCNHVLVEDVGVKNWDKWNLGSCRFYWYRATRGHMGEIMEVCGEKFVSCQSISPSTAFDSIIQDESPSSGLQDCRRDFYCSFMEAAWMDTEKMKG
jgi:hypothetical protein